jgi:hypothetical protein
MTLSGGSERPPSDVDANSSHRPESDGVAAPRLYSGSQDHSPNESEDGTVSTRRPLVTTQITPLSAVLGVRMHGRSWRTYRRLHALVLPGFGHTALSLPT